MDGSLTPCRDDSNRVYIRMNENKIPGLQQIFCSLWDESLLRRVLSGNDIRPVCTELSKQQCRFGMPLNFQMMPRD